MTILYGFNGGKIISGDLLSTFDTPPQVPFVPVKML